MEDQSFWRKCTTCKKPILYGSKYWICSVSTCNRIRTGLVFCNVACFDAHIPVLNHRDAGAIEKRAPTVPHLPQHSIKTSTAVPSSPREDEILVVVSKVKDYVRQQSGFNTSERVMDVLSKKMRAYMRTAIQRAEQAQRKTVLDRDIDD